MGELLLLLLLRLRSVILLLLDGAGLLLLLLLLLRLLVLWCTEPRLPAALISLFRKPPSGKEMGGGRGEGKK